MTAPPPGQNPEQPTPTRFAWDGLSFLTPPQWHLAMYTIGKRRLMRIEVEDDHAIRLEAEWIRPRRRLDMGRIQKRYDQQAKRLTRLARENHRLAAPPGWVGVRYLMDSGEQLVTAFYLSPNSTVFCFFIFHFDPRDNEDPEAVFRLVTDSLRLHEEGPVPWRLYDVDLLLPADMRLVLAKFELGQKHMVFGQGRRRLYLWVVSLADQVLKGHRVENWAAWRLPRTKLFKGVRFSPGEDGEVHVRRRRRHIIGHAREIFAWLFRYRARCGVDRNKNQIIMWVYHHATPSDLDALMPLDPTKGLHSTT